MATLGRKRTLGFDDVELSYPNVPKANRVAVILEFDWRRTVRPVGRLADVKRLPSELDMVLDDDAVVDHSSGCGSN